MGRAPRWPNLWESLSLTPSAGRVQSWPDARNASVVIVAFAGVQPLDVVGPHEVFAGATPGRRPHRAGPSGYRVTRGLDRRRHRSGPRAASDWSPHPLPDSAPSASTRWSWPEESGAQTAAAADEDLVGVDPRRRRRAAAGSPPCARARSSPLRPGCTQDTASPPTGPVPERLRQQLTADVVEPRPDLHPPGQAVDERRRDGGHRPGAGAGPRRRRPRRGADGRPLARRCSSIGPVARPKSPSPVWVPRAERSTVHAVQALVEAAPGGDHRLSDMAAAAAGERAPLRPRTRREVGETPAHFVERVGASKRRAASSRPPRTPSRSSPHVVASAPGRRCVCVFQRLPQRATRVVPPAVPYRRSNPKGRPHDRPQVQVAIPLFPRFTALDAGGPLRGAAAHPDDGRHHRRAPARRGAQ